MTTYALLHTIFFFFVYAFLGWCVEVAYAAITTRELVNRGFLNGPICPIYGCGMTVMIAVLGRFTMPSSDMAWYQNVLVAFFGGMVITTLVELVGGYILYKMFHTRWWDYSMYRFNLGGFICPQFSLLWGLGSVLLMVVVHPLLSKPSAAIPTLVLIWLDVIFGGLFLADLIVSAIQAVGFSKQLARIDELRKAMRTTSDALTEVIGTSAMTMDTLLDEQKLQLTLAAMEGATNAAELRDQLRELAGKAGTLRDTTIRLSKPGHGPPPARSTGLPAHWPDQSHRPRQSRRQTGRKNRQERHEKRRQVNISLYQKPPGSKQSTCRPAVLLFLFVVWDF